MAQYWLIAIGYLCVGINLEINGLGVVLPTFIGYAMIAGSAWALREQQKFFQWAVFPAAILSAMTFPDLFRSYTWQALATYDAIIWWPSFFLELGLFALLGVGLWREASIYDNHAIRYAIGFAAVFIPAVLLAWWTFPMDDDASRLISYLTYWVPSLYYAGLFAGAAKKLP